MDNFLLESWGEHIVYKSGKSLRQRLITEGDQILKGKNLVFLDARFKVFFNIPIFRFCLDCPQIKFQTLTVFKDSNDVVSIYDVNNELLPSYFKIQYLNFKSGLGGFCNIAIQGNPDLVIQVRVSVEDEHHIELFMQRCQGLEGLGLIPSDYVRLVPDKIPTLCPKHRDHKKYLEQSNKSGEGVYLIQCGDKYKIGKATKVKSRLGELQVGNPEELTLIHFIPCKNSFDFESLLHKKFKHRSVRGEWFKLSFADVERIVTDSWLSPLEKYNLGLPLSDTDRDELAENDDETWDYPGSPYREDFNDYD